MPAFLFLVNARLVLANPTRRFAATAHFALYALGEPKGHFWDRVIPHIKRRAQD